MNILDNYVFYYNETDHARAPFITAMSNGKLILGFNLIHNDYQLTHDWDTRQKAHYIIGETPAELAVNSPRLLTGRHSMPPMFFETSKGKLLAVYNSHHEYEYDSEEAKQILADKELHPFTKTRRSDVFTNADGSRGEQRLSEKDYLRMIDNSEGEVGTVGLLNPVSVYASDDYGESWHEQGKIYSKPDKEKGPAGFRGNMIEVNSELLIACNWKDDVDTYTRHVYLMSSSDEGVSWQIKSKIAGPEECPNETSLYQNPDGRLTAIMRTMEGYLCLAHSDDNGESWGEMIKSSVWGFPAHAILHSSGKVVLTYGYRNKPKGTKVKILNADLTDFDTAPEYYVVQYDEEGSGGGGYPYAVELKDGSVLIVYYDRIVPYGASAIMGTKISID
ncbi:MAG: sialidase family protein [Planctomycetota bacterium]|jgi:hypothetical protein